MPLDACARRGGRVRERDVPCVAHNTTERERWSAHARQANEKNERCKRKARARMTGVHARDGKEKRATCTRDGLLHYRSTTGALPEHYRSTTGALPEHCRSTTGGATDGVA